MKLQRSTLFLVAIAALFGIVVGVMEVRRSGDPTAPQATDTEGAPSPLYTFEEADVTEIHIETQGAEVTLVRDADTLWQMTAPETAPAEEAAIAFLLSRLTTDGRLKTVTVDAAARADFGLDVPFATVDLTLADGSTHQLVLGGADFSGSAYYALVDPPQVPLPADAGEVSVAIVPGDVISAVDRPVAEWLAVVDAPSDSTDAVDPATPSEDLPLPTPPTVESAPATPPASAPE